MKTINKNVKKPILFQHRSNISNDYQLFDNNILGKGSSAKVIKAIHKSTNIQYAVKIIPKNQSSQTTRISTQIQLLKNLDYPYIIKLYDTYEDSLNTYLIFELCNGGELFEKVVNQGLINQKQAKIIFRGMVKAVRFCHSNNVCHRDIKPDNFMFGTKNNLQSLKLIDFGLSTRIKQNKKLKSVLGTIYYISPQVLQGNYDLSCDIWSLGVTLYTILSGVLPFKGSTDSEIKQKIKSRKFTFDLPQFKYTSAQVKDLITKCLATPFMRLNTAEILQHPWFQDNITKIPNFLSDENHHKIKKACSLDTKTSKTKTNALINDRVNIIEYSETKQSFNNEYLNTDASHISKIDLKQQKMNDYLFTSELDQVITQQQLTLFNPLLLQPEVKSVTIKSKINHTSRRVDSIRYYSKNLLQSEKLPTYIKGSVIRDYYPKFSSHLKESLHK